MIFKASHFIDGAFETMLRFVNGGSIIYVPLSYFKSVACIRGDIASCDIQTVTLSWSLRKELRHQQGVLIDGVLLSSSDAALYYDKRLQCSNVGGLVIYTKVVVTDEEKKLIHSAITSHLHLLRDVAHVVFLYTINFLSSTDMVLKCAFEGVPDSSKVKRVLSSVLQNNKWLISDVKVYPLGDCYKVAVHFDSR